MRKLSVKTLVTTALFIAISIVLARFCVIYITPSVRINFGNIPIMLTGLLFGPIIGAAAGAIADVVGSVSLAALGWYPPITVSAALMGLIPGLLAFLVKREQTLPRTAVIVFVSNLCASMLWTTFWLSKLYGNGFWTLASVRVPLYLGMTVVESIVIFAVYKAILKTGVIKSE